MVGVPDDILGEKIIAIVSFRELEQNSGISSNEEKNENNFIFLEKNNKFQNLKGLRSFLSGTLSPYKMPQELFIVENIPRNHLGKVSDDYNFIFYFILFYCSVLIDLIQFDFLSFILISIANFVYVFFF